MPPPPPPAAATGHGRPEPNAHAITTGDPDLLLDLVRGAAIQVEATAVPNGKIELTQFEGELLSFTSGRLKVPILSFGEIDSDVVLFGLQLSDGEGSWNASPFEERALWAYGPGSEHEGVGTETPSWAAITVPCELAAALDPNDEPDLACGERRLYVTDAVATLAGTIRQANALIARGATDSLIADNIETAVLAELADVLAADPVELPSESAADRIVAQCIETASTLGPIPNVAELAAAVGATSRWVRAAFNQRFGMPPSVWFRVRALHGARRDLTSADPSQTSVTKIATDWGFWHLGRFAGTYHQHFGERPSETLKQPSRQVRPLEHANYGPRAVGPP